jgi:hemin uptake protein HemP
MGQKSVARHSRPEVSVPENKMDRVVDSCTLLTGTNHLWIRHRGELYRLQLTRNDRLILVK